MFAASHKMSTRGKCEFWIRGCLEIAEKPKTVFAHLMWEARNGILRGVIAFCEKTKSAF